MSGKIAAASIQPCRVLSHAFNANLSSNSLNIDVLLQVYLALECSITPSIYVFMLKVNSTIDVTSLKYHGCSLVSKIHWNGYGFAMVVLMSVFVFKYNFIMC